eukprot:gb/GECG01011393.1/.p1 GENE.gb/GECG01011393.1/~~gb/GECG01011393.1/.p1  ORF type:complete len:139 (+),score=16.13 gb/GECG01011393.1/:1-417(+)
MEVVFPTSLLLLSTIWETWGRQKLLGSQKIQKKGIELLKYAAHFRNQLSMEKLGDVYSGNYADVGEDLDEAAYWYAMGASMRKRKDGMPTHWSQICRQKLQDLIDRGNVRAKEELRKAQQGDSRTHDSAGEEDCCSIL